MPPMPMPVLLPLIALIAPIDDARTCRVTLSGPQGSYSVERDVFANPEARPFTHQSWSVRNGAVQLGVSWLRATPGPPPGGEMTYITLFDVPKGLRDVRMELRRGNAVAAAGGWTDMADGSSTVINLPLYWRELRRAVKAGALTLAVAGRDGRLFAGATLDPAVIDAPGALAAAARPAFAAKIADWRNRCDPYAPPPF